MMMAAIGQQAHGRGKAGADVTTRDTKGQNAADWATTGKSTKLAAELRELIAPGSQAGAARGAAEAESVDDDGAAGRRASRRGQVRAAQPGAASRRVAVTGT